MAKRGYTIYEVIAYTISGKVIKLTLTKSAKKQLISKMRNSVTSKGFKGVKGSVNIYNKQGKVVKSLPLSSLKPYIKEL